MPERRDACSLFAMALVTRLARRFNDCTRRAKREAVALGAKAHDTAVRHVGNRRMMPERLAPVHVRQMNFDHRDFDGQNRVANRNAGMCVRAGVQQQYVALAARILDSIHDRALAVGLERLDFHFKFASQLLKFLVDIGEAGMTVNVRLSFSEQIQVGSMHDQHRDWIARRFAGQAFRLRANRPLHHPHTAPIRIEPHGESDCKRADRYESTVSVIGGFVIFARFKDILIHFATSAPTQLSHNGTSLLKAKPRFPKSFDGDRNLDRYWRTIARSGRRSRGTCNYDRYFAKRRRLAKTTFEIKQRPTNRL